MTRTYIIDYPGKSYTWGLVVHLPEEAAADMRADGLNLCEVSNIVPHWAANLGLTRLWCLVQDIWNWPSNWGRK